MLSALLYSSTKRPDWTDSADIPFRQTLDKGERAEATPTRVRNQTEDENEAYSSLSLLLSTQLQLNTCLHVPCLRSPQLQQ